MTEQTQAKSETGAVPIARPTPYVAPQPTAPSDSALTRAWNALLRERRLPYQLQQYLDSMALRCGIKQKTMRVDDLRVRVRRKSTDELFVTNILQQEEYNPPGYEIKPHDQVIDIGGNIGSFALLAATRAAQGHVLTIEPISENFNLLNHNIRLNRLSNVRPLQAAVLDQKQTIRIYLNENSTGGHSIHQQLGSDAASYEEVQAVTLPDLFDEYHIDRCNFLKLDCEGAEHQILHNLASEYYQRIDKIVMEYHGTSMEEKRSQSDRIVARLEAEGFEVTDYLDFIHFKSGFIRAKRKT